MAGVLHECTGEEQRTVVHFLWAKGLSTEEVPQELKLAIHHRRPGLLTKGVILLDDKALPHTEAPLDLL
ncbi:hypothetical protein J437_LFUL011145 [Ladona fulva]|uniref:Uncharacterized protein n=1 Tax=Ladona fulva TaxID=123851 RepID=A0A8K0P0M4_LADFU|nr:hypothetical protein J437_LFUL011145 [Ladona fulva]